MEFLLDGVYENHDNGIVSNDTKKWYKKKTHF